MKFSLQKNRSKLLVCEDVTSNFGTHLYYYLFFPMSPKISYHQKFLYNKNWPFRSPVPFLSFNSYKDVIILIIYYYILFRTRNYFLLRGNKCKKSIIINFNIMPFTTYVVTLFKFAIHTFFLFFYCIAY